MLTKAVRSFAASMKEPLTTHLGRVVHGTVHPQEIKIVTPELGVAVLIGSISQYKYYNLRRSRGVSRALAPFVIKTNTDEKIWLAKYYFKVSLPVTVLAMVSQLYRIGYRCEKKHPESEHNLRTPEDLTDLLDLDSDSFLDHIGMVIKLNRDGEAEVQTVDEMPPMVKDALTQMKIKLEEKDLSPEELLKRKGI